MKLFASTLFFFLVTQSMIHASDITWHSFGKTENQKISIGKNTLQFSTDTTDVSKDASFKEDYLTLNLTLANGKIIKHSFTSSYGFGKVAIIDNYLLLEVGIGRGTSVREEYLYVFKVNRHLVTLAEIKTSYYCTVPQQASPEKFSYKCSYQMTKKSFEVKLKLLKPREELPAEKIFTVKNK